MSRYSFYAPYVPVAERRRQAQKKLQSLAKKGVVIEPLGELSHRTKIAASFWGKSWCEHLESYSDYSNRLPRGRTYVRNGSVVHLAIRKGEIDAMVQGSELYNLHINIQPLPAEKWKAIQTQCRGKIGSLIELLQGKISGEIMAIVIDRKEGLFPSPSEIKMTCSCPDSARLCKHLAAVLYGVGARLDQQPELLFTLRGVDHTALISAADAMTALTQPGSGRGRRRLSSENLDNVFGIELDTPEATPPAAAPPATPALEASPPVQKRKKTKIDKPFNPTGALVRRLREKSGLGKTAFARELRIGISTVDLWEKQPGTLSLHAKNFEKLKAFAEKHLPSKTPASENK